MRSDNDHTPDSVGLASTSSPVSLAFVIPARNEAEHIGAVIDSIHKFANISDYEIVVVDNGSIDDTPGIARTKGAKVIICPGVTVAELRNLGVAQTSGKVLIFLDGDVLLTERWRDALPRVLADLLQHPNTVTGSRCGISQHGSWIERTWFMPLLTERPNYINSGHLLTSRELFLQLHGFNQNLETGEDSDFSHRARTLGARIINNPDLKVIHEGYPKTLSKFIRREMWHGRGNFQSLRLLARSKIASMTLLFILLHGVLLFGIIIGLVSFTSMLLAGVAIVGLCILASYIKYRRPALTVLLNTYLYYWYFLARSLAAIQIFVSLPWSLLKTKRKVSISHLKP